MGMAALVPYVVHRPLLYKGGILRLLELLGIIEIVLCHFSRVTSPQIAYWAITVTVAAPLTLVSRSVPWALARGTCSRKARCMPGCKFAAWATYDSATREIVFHKTGTHAAMPPAQPYVPTAQPYVPAPAYAAWPPCTRSRNHPPTMRWVALSLCSVRWSTARPSVAARRSSKEVELEGVG